MGMNKDWVLVYVDLAIGWLNFLVGNIWIGVFMVVLSVMLVYKIAQLERINSEIKEIEDFMNLLAKDVEKRQKHKDRLNGKNKKDET